MRPKRVVICVGADEDKLSSRVFLLQVHGYRVIRASDIDQAKVLLELEVAWGLGAHVLLLHLPLECVDAKIGEIRKVQPDLPIVITSDGCGYDRAHCADAYLPKGTWSPVELVERVRMFTSRKRGPKKKPVQSASQLASGLAREGRRA
jgi:two-component system, OmpR family, response regulator CpxR